MAESDAELSRRMQVDATIQCANIYRTNDDVRAMIAKAWMAGARWMLYELQPRQDKKRP